MYTIQDPLIKKLDIKISQLVNTNFLGSYKTAFKGQGIEFKDIRPYDHGDPYKSIDRITTAKKGELHVKQFEEERQLNIWFCLDVARSMDFGTGYGEEIKTKRQTMLELYYMLALTAMRNNDKIGTVLFDDRIQETIKLSKQKSMMYKAAKHIITDLHTKSYKSNVNIALEQLFKQKFSHGLIVILTDDDKDINPKLIKILAQKNDLLYVHISNSFENTLGYQSETRGNRPLLAAESIQLRWEKGSKVLSPSKAKVEKYMALREEQLYTLEKTIQSKGGDCLLVDETTNLGAILLRYFMTKRK